MTLMAKVGSGKTKGLPNAEARAKAVVRVDVVFLERMRQVHIGPTLVYPAVGAVLIVYTTTRDSSSPFATAHFPPQQYRVEIGPSNQGPRIHLTHAVVEKSKGTLASSLNSKLRVVPSRIRKHIVCGRRRARWYSLGSCLCCTGVPSNALRVNDEPRLAGVEAALRGFLGDYLGLWVGNVR